MEERKKRTPTKQSKPHSKDPQELPSCFEAGEENGHCRENYHTKRKRPKIKQEDKRFKSSVTTQHFDKRGLCMHVSAMKQLGQKHRHLSTTKPIHYPELQISPSFSQPPNKEDGEHAYHTLTKIQRTRVTQKKERIREHKKRQLASSEVS